MKKPVFQVLVAEDDEDDQLLISEAFERLGADVDLRFADDGVAALDALHDYDEGGRSPLLVLDLNMPRMSGHEVLTTLRHGGAHTLAPVVVLSTSGSAEDVEKSYALGANSHCVKPDSFESLRDLVGALHAFWGRHVQVPPPRAS